MLKSYLFPLLSVCLTISLLGCKKDNQESYVVNKSIPQQVANSSFSIPQSTPNLEQDAKQFKAPRWDPPQEWKSIPLGNMRKGAWVVQEPDSSRVEITVLAFPGDVGGDLANTNRWAQQIGLPPLSLEEMENISEFLNIDEHKARFLTLINTETSQPSAIMVALVPVEVGTWFFKAMGDADAVLRQKNNMVKFLDTVEFSKMN